MIKNICCKEGMRQLADNSIDSIVTDPPYELGFMGKKWDNTGIAYDPEVWVECLRVLKPGGYLLSFSSSRTYHRMTVAIEDAGFEIRDQIMWVQSQGFPKHKTLLKPAHEPICVARKGGKSAGLNTNLCRNGERYPTNFIHDGLDELWARYFYCAKTNKTDRNEGLDHMELKNNMRVNAPRENEEDKHSTLHQNNHPTVKPTELMRYLCRLVTPPNGIVLDPFSGSGSTGKAAVLEGFRFIGFEKEPEYATIANSRVSAALCEDLIG